MAKLCDLHTGSYSIPILKKHSVRSFLITFKTIFMKLQLRNPSGINALISSVEPTVHLIIYLCLIHLEKTPLQKLY